jgi:hypothetical protein
MASYYVNNNRQPSGDYEVHVTGCNYMPSNRSYLGDYVSCAPAVAKANQTHHPANGCYWCCRACHTG